MGLDIVAVAEQMPALLERFGAERQIAVGRLQAARAALSDAARDPERWRVRAGSARTRWPLALPMGEVADRAHDPPPTIGPYAALGVDGSHIDVDRHAAARCYVLNLGWASIAYDGVHVPHLASRSELQLASAEGAERDESDASAEDHVRGQVLSLLREVRELALLADLAPALPEPLPGIALLDGNMGLWTVAQAAISKRLRERLIYGDGGLRPSLDALRRLSHRRDVAVGAYTSAPGTADIVHALRVDVCPLAEVACTSCPGLTARLRPCDSVGLSSDAELFWDLLRPGQRSAVFLVRSRMFLRAGEGAAQPWYEADGHGVAFFYLRLQEEIVRVEMPVWTAEDRIRVDLLHAALLDQCDKGPGYPVVLQEAHEQAVITTVDRRSFAALLDREVEETAGVGGSAKARSKRMRGI